MTPYLPGRDACAHCGHRLGNLTQSGPFLGYQRPEDVAKQVASGRSRGFYRYRHLFLAALTAWFAVTLHFDPSQWPLLIVPVSIALILYLGTRKS